MSLRGKKLAIILPAYNESKNLRTLLKRINKIVPNVHIVVVDDSSPLENKKITRIAASYRNVEVITREKKLGRGSAVLAGFAHALKEKTYEYFVEMDTDLGHDSAELPVLEKALDANKAHLVIGSRYLFGSKIVNWSPKRLFLSKLINFFLNLWLGVGLHDYTDGYRMYRRKAVEYLVKTGLYEKGFIALSESAFLLHKRGYRIVEAPVSFTERIHGESSVGVKEVFMSLVGALRIKIRYNLVYNQKKSGFPLSKKQSIVVILAIAVALRLWDFNAMGKTWDEPAYVEQGYYMVEAIKRGDFDNKQLYHSDHPPLARYVYGLAEHLQIGDNHKQGENFPYDYTYPRLVSLVFSLSSVILVFLLGWQYISSFVGFIAALILATLPFFLGFSQLATLESLNMFFFTASVYGFIKLIHTQARKWIILTGIAAGLAMLVKQSNVFIYPLLSALYFLWVFYDQKSKSRKDNIRLGMIWGVIIGIVSVITFFALWPFILFHIHDVLSVQDTMWIKNVSLPPPEVFFGRLMLVPMPYYFVLFLITTPVMILLFLILGLLRIDRLKKWILFAVVIWFIFPFLQSFYNFKQHGVRYIIQIYAPMAIIAAIGFETLIYSLTTRKLYKILAVLALVTYMFFILWKATPYYLDYFNGFVGGTNGVHEKKIFQLGWWGQGLKEAGTYIEKNAKPGSRIGLAVQPPFSFPPLAKHKIDEYNSKKKYDYVVVSYFQVLREGFDDSLIRQTYQPVYTVYADKAAIVIVYGRKHK
jgi:dolichol-phosphate mannosyltransferase